MQKTIFLLIFVLISLSTVFSQNVQCKVYLQAPYTSGGMMNTSLNDSIPLFHPYNTSPWYYSGTESLAAIPANMTDWVMLELRDNNTPSIIEDRRAAILLSDGNVVDTNLQPEVSFYAASPGHYHICIFHRNHIPVMSKNAVALPNSVIYDFSDTLNFPPFGGGSQALVEVEPGVYAMIAGDVNRDGILKFSGPDNDRGAILQYLLSQSGSANITSVLNAYREEDINMNMEVKYSGPGNDPSVIIQNLIILTKTNSITAVYKSPVPNGSFSAFICGDTLLDVRDNTKYSTTLIDNQCWMAENLNFGNMVAGSSGQSDNGIPEKYCYEDNPARCDDYGGLYTWDEMMQYSNVESSKGVCPDGWHIPSDEEWKILEGTLDSQFGIGEPEWEKTGNRGTDAACKLKETGTTHWSIPNTCATNSSGFTALPGGYHIFSFVYYYLSVQGYYWTSSEVDTGSSYDREFFSNSQFVGRNNWDKSYGCSVRCVKN
jgi:uncharacterized protein (TIGR02145 family)